VRGAGSIPFYLRFLQKFFGEWVNNININKEMIKLATKTETIAIKVAPEEKEKIKKLAAAADVTVSKYLYNIIFKGDNKNEK
jgi:hypothetical protein